MFQFAATVLVLGVASQRAAAQISWLKAAGTNVCGGIVQDSTGVSESDRTYFANCNSDNDQISQYISMENSALFAACAADYVADDDNFNAIDQTGNPVTCSELQTGAQIPNQDCTYASSSGSAYIGTAASGGSSTTTYYIITGGSECSTDKNNFFTAGSPSSGCSNQEYCIGPGAGTACGTRTFKNTEIKFSALLKLHGTSMTSAATSYGNCASGLSPTHVGGRIFINTAMLGSGSNVTVNGDTLTAATVGATTAITTMKVNFASGTSVQFTYPTLFNYGEGQDKKGEANLKVVAHPATGGIYLDYLVPVQYLEKKNDFVAYDPVTTGNVQTPTGAVSVSASVLMVASLSFVASLLQ